VDDTGTPTVLILGGRSEIGIELAVRLAPGAIDRAGGPPTPTGSMTKSRRFAGPGRRM